ncbi:MAG: AIR synthase related protein [Haloferacaceae archaeon]
MAGKLTREVLERLVFARTGTANPDVLVGPAYGEDAAAIDLGDRTLVASTDPVSLAAGRIGRIGVAVATNDVAVAGARPEFLLVTLLLPDPDVDLLDAITADLDAEADRLGTTIVGGHTETVAGLDRPLLSIACLGVADRHVRTGGANVGDVLLVTKAAGIEATAVLATDFRADLALPDDPCDAAAGFFDDLSVLREASALTPLATTMHDPTEGGILQGAIELALTGDVGIEIDPDAIPVREETERLCAAAGVDPFRVLGSGALLATVDPADREAALAAIDDAGVAGRVVGRVVDGPPGVRLGDERHVDPIRDDMYALWN